MWGTSGVAIPICHVASLFCSSTQGHETSSLAEREEGSFPANNAPREQNKFFLSSSFSLALLTNGVWTRMGTPNPEIIFNSVPAPIALMLF